MPNHVRNKLEVSGTRVQLGLLMKKMKSEDINFNFDNVIKMPLELDRISPFRAESENEKLMTPERLEEFRLGLIEDFGHDTWYGWCSENWGTKWNSYENSMKIEDGKVIYTFTTAWARPTPVIVELAKMFDKCSFVHSFACESYNFWGNESYEGGELKKSNFYEDGDENLSDEMMKYFREIFMELHDHDPFEENCD